MKRRQRNEMYWIGLEKGYVHCSGTGMVAEVDTNTGDMRNLVEK